MREDKLGDLSMELFVDILQLTKELRAKRENVISNQIPSPQPHYATEIDAGHETPGAARLLGFFHANFSSENKKMQMPLFAARAGIELKNHIFGGRILTFL